LNELGFETHDEEFTFSEFPARFGPFLCGSTFALLVWLAAEIAVERHQLVLGILVAMAAGVACVILGRLLLDSVPTYWRMRSSSRNLVASRGESPSVWLVAHTDSKSQTIPMVIRIASLLVAFTMYFVLIGMMVGIYFGYPVAMGIAGHVAETQIHDLAILAIIAIVPFALCFITNRSPGALDNASGVVSVLLASELVSKEKSFGVVFTSGEELALAGAKAFVARRERTGIAINCDTIDDDGWFVARRDSVGKRAYSALASSVTLSGAKLRRGGIPGILTDGIAFGKSGWETATLSRGNLGTLARVHTSSDSPGRIDGTGIASAARILADTVEELA
jgi:hypothetical protein